MQALEQSPASRRCKDFVPVAMHMGWGNDLYIHGGSGTSGYRGELTAGEWGKKYGYKFGAAPTLSRPESCLPFVAMHQQFLVQRRCHLYRGSTKYCAARALPAGKVSRSTTATAGRVRTTGSEPHPSGFQSLRRPPKVELDQCPYNLHHEARVLPWCASGGSGGRLIHTSRVGERQGRRNRVHGSLFSASFALLQNTSSRQGVLASESNTTKHPVSGNSRRRNEVRTMPNVGSISRVLCRDDDLHSN